MKFDRVVQVRVSLPDETGRFGTGYLIAPRLVLTAAHVVRGAARRRGVVRVRCPDAGSPDFAADVRWRGTGATLDAALVEVTGDGWVPPDSWSSGRAAQRFGRLITTAAGQPATARGFRTGSGRPVPGSTST